MVQTSSSQGRYYLLEFGPVASPGHCTICGFSGSERRYLDPRLDFDEFGSVIFCEECMASMAQVMGFLTPAVAKTLEDRVEDAETELVKLRAAVAAMEDLRVALGSFGGSPVSDFASGLYLPEPTPSIADQIAAGDVVEEGLGDSATDESVSQQGPDDVRDDSADNDFTFGL